MIIKKIPIIDLFGNSENTNFKNSNLETVVKLPILV